MYSYVQNLEDVKKLAGKKFKDIFYQPTAMFLGDDIFVINFGKRLEFSLHVATYLRFILDNQLLLTSSDIFFSQTYQKLDYEDTNISTLLDKNLSKVKQMLIGSYVSSVTITSTSDLIIVFNNNVELEIITDALSEDYEYYRLMGFGKNKGAVIVYSSKGEICVRSDA